MIENVLYKAENDVLIEYDFNGEHKQILFSDINSYWEYATEEDFEGGAAYVIKEEVGNKVKCYLTFNMLTADSQAGVIVVWDPETEKVVHISSGDYCQAIAVFEKKVFYLCKVANFVTPYHYQLYTIPLFTQDIGDGGKRLYCQNPCEIKETEYNSIELKVDENGIRVLIDESKEYIYSSTVDETVNQVRNEEFAYLYDVFTDDPKTHEYELVDDLGIESKIDISILKVRGMLT